jgi:hypothetical protein
MGLNIDDDAGSHARLVHVSAAGQSATPFSDDAAPGSETRVAPIAVEPSGAVWAGEHRFSEDSDGTSLAAPACSVSLLPAPSAEPT